MNAEERQSQARSYGQAKGIYEQLATQTTNLLNSLGPKAAIQAINARVKSEESFLIKSLKTKDDQSFRYENPLLDIEDLIGVRVICYTLSNVEQISETVRQNFSVVEEIDKAEELTRAGSIGYVSKHFIVNVSDNRKYLPEYADVRDLKTEIQVRTVFQHAWAELEHRLQYKSSPNPALRARFLALAGLVQVVDREFEGVVHLGGALIEENRETVKLVEDFEGPDDGELGHKLSDAAYMFGIRPRDLVIEERFDDAIRSYDKLIELQPNQIWHYVGRAKAKALLGDIPGVAYDVEKIRHINSSDTRSKKALRELVKIIEKN